MDLTVAIYQLTEKFPKNEMYGLTAQMRRASISIPSNIAEGSRRGTRKDFRYFVLNAFGSGAELETQIQLAQKLQFASKVDYTKADVLLGEIMRMLNKMSATLQ